MAMDFEVCPVVIDNLLPFEVGFFQNCALFIFEDIHGGEFEDYDCVNVVMHCLAPFVCILETRCEVETRAVCKIAIAINVACFNSVCDYLVCVFMCC